MTEWHDQDPLNGARGFVIWLPICIVAWCAVALVAAWIARGVAGV